MADPNVLTDEEADRLYEQYAKPLERDHWGKFVVIARDGRTIVGDSLLEIVDRAVTEFGPGTYTCKIGERFVGRLR